MKVAVIITTSFFVPQTRVKSTFYVKILFGRIFYDSRHVATEMEFLTSGDSVHNLFWYLNIIILYV